MNNFIKQEYCKEFGYGSFNKYNKSDYSNWLEKKLIEARTQVENLTIHSVVVPKGKLVCGACKIPLKKFDDSRPYCCECLTIYKAN